MSDTQTAYYTVEAMANVLKQANAGYDNILRLLDKMDAGMVADCQMIYNRDGEILEAVTKMVPIMERMVGVMENQQLKIDQLAKGKVSKLKIAAAIGVGVYVGIKVNESLKKKEK